MVWPLIYGICLSTKDLRVSTFDRDHKNSDNSNYDQPCSQSITCEPVYKVTLQCSVYAVDTWLFLVLEHAANKWR